MPAVVTIICSLIIVGGLSDLASIRQKHNAIDLGDQIDQLNKSNTMLYQGVENLEADKIMNLVDQLVEEAKSIHELDRQRRRLQAAIEEIDRRI